MTWVHTLVDTLQAVAIVSLAFGCLWQKRTIDYLQSALMREHINRVESINIERRARERAEAELRRYIDDVAAITLPEDLLRKVRPQGD